MNNKSLSNFNTNKLISRISALNRRQRTLIVTSIAAVLLLSIVAGGLFLNERGLTTNFNQRNISPTLNHPFGTDWMGRDMFTRTIKGLTLSMGVGLLATSVSVIIALIL